MLYVVMAQLPGIGEAFFARAISFIYAHGFSHSSPYPLKSSVNGLATMGTGGHSIRASKTLDHDLQAPLLAADPTLL